MHWILVKTSTFLMHVFGFALCKYIDRQIFYGFNFSMLFSFSFFSFFFFIIIVIFWCIQFYLGSFVRCSFRSFSICWVSFLCVLSTMRFTVHVLVGNRPEQNATTLLVASFNILLICFFFFILYFIVVVLKPFWRVKIRDETDTKKKKQNNNQQHRICIVYVNDRVQ